MRLRLFTFLVMFLATMSGAVWAEENPTTSENDPYDLATRGGLEITDSQTYYVTSTSFSENGITISGGDRVEPIIYLKGIKISVAGTAIEIKGNCDPVLVIQGENYIKSEHGPAISVPRDDNTSLLISEASTGILDIQMSSSDYVAIGNSYGGSYNTSRTSGEVEFQGGTIITNGKMGRFLDHHMNLNGNSIVLVEEIDGNIDRNEGLLAEGSKTVTIYGDAVDIKSPLPEGYSINVETGKTVSIGEGQSLTEDQVRLEGGTMVAYKVSYDSPTLGFAVPATKYHGPKYSTEELAKTTKDYEGGTYALLTTNLWENTDGASGSWVAANTKQENKGTISELTEVKYSLVGTLTEKTLNLLASEGLTKSFDLWYPTNASITAAEPEEPEGAAKLATYGMQLNNNASVSKVESFSKLEATTNQEVKINLTSESISSINQAVLKITVTDDATSVTDESITITVNDPKWVYDGKVKTDLSNLVTVTKNKGGDTPTTYTYGVDYTLEFSLDYNAWTPINAGTDLKDADDYYIKVIGKNTLKDRSTPSENCKVSIAPADLTITVATTPQVNVGTELSSVEFPAATYLSYTTAVEGEKVSFSGNLTVKDDDFSTATATTIEDAFSHDQVTLVADETTQSQFKESNYKITWPEKISLVVGKITINPGDGGEGEGGDDITGGEDSDNDGEIDFVLIHPEGEDKCSVYDGLSHGLDVLLVGNNKLTAGEDKDFTVLYNGSKEEPVNAGEYTATIKLNENGKYQLEGGESEFSLTLTIAERPLTVSFGNFPESISIDTEYLNAVDYAIWENLVYGEKPICEGTLALVESQTHPGYFNIFLERESFKVRDNEITGFMVSNYEISVEDCSGSLYALNGNDGEEGLPEGGDDITVEEPDDEGGIKVDDDDFSGSISGTTTRYQLNLAAKNYLESYKDEYKAEGLELFSRHDKFTTKAGSSFTIWYEHNGVANDGEYRIFIRRGRSGSWTELKIDTVSDYYQIRNVQTDIYVKIYGLNGYPVANEEISATDARAYAQANKIVVITPEPTDVQIISMAGAVVATDKVTGQREFGNLTAGIYIVRMGETVVKLQVRN